MSQGCSHRQLYSQVPSRAFRAPTLPAEGKPSPGLVAVDCSCASRRDSAAATQLRNSRFKHQHITIFKLSQARMVLAQWHTW